jgi:hypothetical protein
MNKYSNTEYECVQVLTLHTDRQIAFRDAENV